MVERVIRKYVVSTFVLGRLLQVVASISRKPLPPKRFSGSDSWLQNSLGRILVCGKNYLHVSSQILCSSPSSTLHND